MKKLLFIVYSLQESNGTERAVINVANELIKFGYEITLLSIVKQNKNCSFDIDKNINLESLDINDSRRIFVYLKSLFTLNFYIKQNSFDVIFGSLVYINIILCFGKIFKKNKIFACEHAPYEHPNKIIQLIRKYFYKFLDGVIVLNHIEAEKFSGIGLSSYQIPNIVPSQVKYSNLNNNTIICVSRMSHEKGIDLLLEVLKIFYSKEENRKVKTKIIGDGHLFDMLKAKGKEYDIHLYIDFCGKVDNINDYYLSSDLVLVTSRYESFGLCIVEGMSFGVPVISFEVDSGPKVIIEDTVNGYLINKLDFNKYAQTIENLLNDKSKLKLLSTNAIESSSKFSEKNIILLWIQLIEGDN